MARWAKDLRVFFGGGKRSFFEDEEIRRYEIGNEDAKSELDQEIGIKMNPNDEKRVMVLRFLYDTRAMRYVEHVQRNNPYVLVNQFVGLDAGQARNVLQYLEGKGLVQIEVTDVVQLKQNEKGLANDLQTKKFYRITATGEEFIEERKKEASIFRQKIESEASMNITNIGGVTVVGNNNIVNAKFGDTYEKLENFKKAVLSSNGLSTEEKINCSSDIETIQKQLSKTSPSKEIVRLAWSAIEASVVLHDFGSVVSELGKQIHGMFT